MLVFAFHTVSCAELSQNQKSYIFRGLLTSYDIGASLIFLFSVGFGSYIGFRFDGSVGVATVIVTALLIIGTLARMRICGFLFFRCQWDLFDLFLLHSSLFIVHSFLWSSDGIEPYMIALYCVRCARVYGGMVSSKESLVYDSRTKIVSIATALTFASVFYIGPPLICGALVSVDVLPGIALPPVGTEGSRVLPISVYGSIYRAIFSLFQVITMDNWFVSLCRPILSNYYSLSVLSVLFVVLVGNFGYSNLLLACMIDKAREVSGAFDEERRLARNSDDQSINKNLIGIIAQNRPKERLAFETIISSAMNSQDALAFLSQLNLNVVDLGLALKVYDVDGTGSVSPPDIEIVLERLHRNAIGQDVVRINSVVSKSLEVGQEVAECVDSLLRLVSDCHVSNTSLGDLLHRRSETFATRGLREARDTERRTNRQLVRKHFDRL